MQRGRGCAFGPAPLGEALGLLAPGPLADVGTVTGARQHGPGSLVEGNGALYMRASASGTFGIRHASASNLKAGGALPVLDVLEDRLGSSVC